MANNTTMDITQEYRTEIERQIVETVVTALEQNPAFSKDDLPLIGDFVLERIDTITTRTAMVDFLEQLAGKWSIFTNLCTTEKGKLQDQKEEQVMKQVLTLAKDGQIDTAIDLAKSATTK